MAFYIKPTDGVISLNNLERFGRTRLIFLNETLRCDGAEGFKRLIYKLETTLGSDCLIEGSKRDRTSHFLLRLVCSEDAEMKNFLLQSETELFCYRFLNMNTAELSRTLKSTHRFVTSCLTFESCSNDEVLCDLYMTLEMIVTSVGSWKSVVKKYMDDCDTETFQIPFQLALSLITGRQILLTKGLAHVPFSKLHVVLSSVFHSVLCKGLERARASVPCLKQEERTSELLSNLRTFCRKLLGKPLSRQLSLPGGHSAINRYQITQEAKCFPPCMRYVHTVLLQRHRLRHHSRIQLTLFLKEAGLPIDEALSFWKETYSLPECDRSGKETKGERSWVKDRKRYTYNIRHLYGLEGSRINYRAHTCKFLQTYIPGPGEVGGCPFSQSDENHLAYLMDVEDIGIPQRSLIQDLIRVKRYSAACREYHKSKIVNSCQLAGSEVIKEFKGITTPMPKYTPVPPGPEEVVKNVPHRQGGIKEEMTSLRAVTGIVQGVCNVCKYNQLETRYEDVVRVRSSGNVVGKRTVKNYCTDVSDLKRRKCSDNHKKGKIKLDQSIEKSGYNWNQEVLLPYQVEIKRLRETEENETKEERRALSTSSKMVSTGSWKPCLSSGLESKTGLPPGLEKSCLSSGLESKSCVNLNEPLMDDNHCDCCGRSKVNKLDDGRTRGSLRCSRPCCDAGHAVSMNRDEPVECCKTSETARGLLDKAFNDDFSKPIDYYYSYKKLLYDLKNVCNTFEV